MFARFRRFRRLLLTEKRDWPERLAFAGALGIPLFAGAVSRILLGYNAADLILAGPFLAGLLAGPYAGALVGLVVGLPGALAGEYGAVPFAVGCGFAGGGLREICPKDAIWHFSPFVFTDLHRYAWRLLRRFQIDWQMHPDHAADPPRAAAPGDRPSLARAHLRLPGQRPADDRR